MKKRRILPMPLAPETPAASLQLPPPSPMGHAAAAQLDSGRDRPSGAAANAHINVHVIGCDDESRAGESRAGESSAQSETSGDEASSASDAGMPVLRQNVSRSKMNAWTCML